jgi:glucose-6-phosphate isomerase
MTKGHFHTVRETADVYYCLKGEGFMVMETSEGGTAVEPMLPGKVLYVAPMGTPVRLHFVGRFW